jgi:lipoic acid synthetase
VLRVRWLGRVPYEEADVLQRALYGCRGEDYLLVLEHPHVFTLGVHADPAHVLVDPAAVGATVVRSDRGGDVTYHGPGQLVVYPVVDVPLGPGAIPDHVHGIEQVVIDALGDLDVDAGRLAGYPGVWVDPRGSTPRKICAVGVRVARGRSRHGLALNVDPDLQWFGRIVPCGIADKAVTSLAAEGAHVSLRAVAEVLIRHAARRWAPDGQLERQDVAWGRAVVDSEDAAAFATPVSLGAPNSRPPGERVRVRLRQAGVDVDSSVPARSRKPPWLRVPAHMGEEFLALRRTVRGLGLVTVCEEAGCPNIFECWADGTATFMINGDRCTRACGFCLVDTRRPLPIDSAEPERVAAAVEQLQLVHAVVTAVARDDLRDGGAAAFAATVRAIKARRPETTVEVLIPDCKGDAGALAAIFGARPDVLNHNMETVARLQRAVRPSASYSRSLAVLARAKRAGLVTKSGLVLGMGERIDEVVGALVDLRGVGTDIVTLGQYLRPTAAHLPVARWVAPEEFEALRIVGEELGFAHIEASPLTRSSYHARGAAAAAGLVPGATAPREPEGQLAAEPAGAR